MGLLCVCLIGVMMPDLQVASACDLFFYPQDPHAEEFEDKEWTFVIENVSTKLSSRSFNCCVCTNTPCLF